eukprot:CAMPEP_0115737396 /NCGR_PEP_ID=MMETSP0272-20121206/87792_1 /TAXON_ID=71861 /ORGANISM="Scrippsiella trochoidea, Strain CCMP3099" /LENGTH=51 /DNA_ID=CAMNT_0003181689 /DNA_START=227 /DNA_END=382 /DNA_ORIENTATION=-
MTASALPGGALGGPQALIAMCFDCGGNGKPVLLDGSALTAPVPSLPILEAP